MPDKRDFYDVLGVSKGCSDAELKAAYRKKAKKYHPDLNPGDKAAESSFKEVNEAYEILSNPDKKAKYDQFGHAGVDPNFGAGGGGFGGGMDFDLGDIFGSFFGGARGGFGGQSSNPNAPMRGNDIHSNANISFFEAAKGCKREIKINRTESCSDCGGSGAQSGTNAATCDQCGGSGQVKTNQRTPFGVFQSTSQCPKCRGKGKIITTPCRMCGGSGRRKVSKTIEVNIPAGIDDGQTIALRSQGDTGINRGPSGDLNITVSVRPDALFERDGFDVWCEIPVSFMQATLGDEITVPTIDGKVKYSIGEGTQPGTTFRLKNKGIPFLNSKGRGDQYVKVTIEVPKGLSKEQKSKIKDFDKSLAAKNCEKINLFSEKLKNFMNR